MFDETCCVPSAACWTFREISCVAAPCSSTAAAMVEEISDSFSKVPLISFMAPTDSWSELRISIQSFDPSTARWIDGLACRSAPDPAPIYKRRRRLCATRRSSQRSIMLNGLISRPHTLVQGRMM